MHSSLQKLFLTLAGITFLFPNVVAAKIYRPDFERADILLSFPHKHEMLVKLKFKDETSLITAKDEPDLRNRLAQYLADPSVEYAEPNYLYQMTAGETNDPLASKQYYLDQIKVTQAWTKTAGTKETIVAVIDSGVDIEHEDLAANIWMNADETAGDGVDNDNNGYVDDIHGYDFVTNTANPNPKAMNGEFNASAIHHGTVVSGLIGAVGNNARGITGVNQKISIMAIRALDHNGGGDLNQIVKAIRYAADNDAAVINMSFAGFASSSALESALQYAYEKNSVLVAAVGNAAVGAIGENTDRVPTYPACSDGTNNRIIGAVALTPTDKKATFSDYGTRCIDLSAPGVNMESTQAVDPSLGLSEAYGDNWNGTSFSAPLVSGVVALMKSVNPGLTNKEVLDILKKTGDNVDAKNIVFAGKIGVKVNAQKALENVSAPVIDPGTLPKPDATLVKLADNPNVYLIDSNNVRHFIPNEPVFYSWGYSFKEVKIVPDMSAYLFGQALKFRDGTLIKGTEAAVFVVTENGKRIWIKDEATFLGLGYQWNRIHWITDGEIALYENIGEWARTDIHPNGTLVQYSGSSDVFLIESGKKRKFSSWDVFGKLGYLTGNIFVIQEKEKYEDGSVIE